MLRKRNDDPQRRLKVVDVNVEGGVGIFAKDEFIFGKSRLEQGTILLHDNVLLLEQRVNSIAIGSG